MKNERTETHACDCISRQWLMERVNEGWIKFKAKKDKNIFIHLVRDMAPSVEPEIIRCKDCKYWMPYDWMLSEICRSHNINDYSEDEIGCEYCDMAMKANDYCSRAERRTDE